MKPTAILPITGVTGQPLELGFAHLQNPFIFSNLHWLLLGLITFSLVYAQPAQCFLALLLSTMLVHDSYS